MRRENVLQEAAFDRKAINYAIVVISMTCAFTCVGIPLIPLVIGLGRWYGERWYQRLRCALTDRSLIVNHGLLYRVEQTVPLDKITDLALYQGPLMRFFGIHGLKVETAGQSAASKSGSLVGLVGIIDAHAFRDRVLDERDSVTDMRSGGSRSTAAAPPGEAQRVPEAVAGTHALALLTDIRDALQRIEVDLRTRDDNAT